jgi:hypothetical protein
MQTLCPCILISCLFYSLSLYVDLFYIFILCTHFKEIQLGAVLTFHIRFSKLSLKLNFLFLV